MQCQNHEYYFEINICEGYSPSQLSWCCINTTPAQLCMCGIVFIQPTRGAMVGARAGPKAPPDVYDLYRTASERVDKVGMQGQLGE